MQLQQFLSSLWLNTIECEIFFACSKFPNSSISSLSRISSKPRSTVHDVIKRLCEQWYIISHKKEKSFLYSSLSYEWIKSILTAKQLETSKQLQQLEMIEPEFQKLQINDASFTTIEYYTWPNAVSMIYNKLSDSKTLRAIYNPQTTLKNSNYTIEQLAWILIDNKIQSKEILLTSEISRSYGDYITQHDGHEIAYITNTSDIEFHADCLITDDTFYFIAFGKENVWIEITNKTFVDSQKIIFDQLWSKQ